MRTAHIGESEQNANIGKPFDYQHFPELNPRQLGATCMNEDRTCANPGTNLTQRRSRSVPRGYVYFIRAGDRIKIGFSRTPNIRLKTLQTGNGERLELLKVIPGSYDLESSLQADFRQFKTIGDWFQANPELLAYIGIATGKFAPVHSTKPERRSVPREAQSMLSSVLRRRREVGPESREGRLLTNLAEQAHWLVDEDSRPWATHPMQTVKGMMEWQAKLLAAGNWPSAIRNSNCSIGLRMEREDD